MAQNFPFFKGNTTLTPISYDVNASFVAVVVVLALALALALVIIVDKNSIEFYLIAR